LDEPFLNNYRIKNEYRIWIKEEDKLLALLPLSHICRLTAAISVIFKRAFRTVKKAGRICFVFASIMLYTGSEL